MIKTYLSILVVFGSFIHIYSQNTFIDIDTKMMRTGLVKFGYPTNILIYRNIIVFKKSGGPGKSTKFDQKVNENYLLFKNEIEKLIAF